jgi:DNA-binding transcriptional ArsR family regulator
MMHVHGEEQLNRTLAALADPTRRAILASLREGRSRVTEIAKPFPVSLNAISKHIAVLERAGLVRREVRGREHYLTMDPKPLDAAAAWIAETRQFWKQRLVALEKALDSQARRGKSDR